MKSSVIIIGGGLGGLFSGAILSKEGYEVTVVEKNRIIGGGLQSFSRFGVTFDTGMHIIGGMQKDGNVRRICEYLGIMDKVSIKDADPTNIDSIYYAEDGHTYHIAQGRRKYVASLAAQFPDQRQNIENYINALYDMAGEADLFYLRPSSDYMQVHSGDFYMPADKFIAKYISDEHLRSVVAYLNPLYGGKRDTTPAYVHALISVLYIDGSSRFAGGSILFAETLRDYIVGNGGRVIAGDAVKTVCSEDKMITGIVTESGLRLSADKYICAIHPCSLFTLLDDPRILPKPYRARLGDLPNAYSAFTLNIKLKPGTYKFFNYTKYYVPRYDAIWDFWDGENWPNGFLYVTPPEIEQGEYAHKLIVTAPMPWSYVEKWADTTVGARGEEYEAWKKDCAEKLLDRMEKIDHGFKDCIEAVNSASPLTIRDFYGVKEGSMYGFSKDCSNIVLSQVPVVTKVPNLYLTGQNCNLHGFCGVSLTAINTCEAILGRNHIVDQINRFADIRPYLEYEIPAATKRIANHPLFPKVMSYLFPGYDLEALRSKVENIDTVYEFQKEIMGSVVEAIISGTCTSCTWNGAKKIEDGNPCLFVSNHRDIMLDATFLTYKLLMDGCDTPEITFGANLMQGDFVVDVGKVNKMFRVERPGDNVRDFYNQSAHLSDYIRYTLLNKRQSIWIAQRNGRTKDGIDRTDQAVIKMFAMSSPGDRVKAVASLRIVPMAISYEWEPCDLLKALELYKRASGPYQKAPGEDLHSIITGVMQQKGGVHMEICDPITEDDLKPFAGMSANVFYKSVSSLIDRRICRAYRLYPNNFIAHDMLHGNRLYMDRYTPEQEAGFRKYISSRLSECEPGIRDEILRILLGIYANPVDSKEMFTD